MPRPIRFLVAVLMAGGCTRQPVAALKPVAPLGDDRARSEFRSERPPVETSRVSKKRVPCPAPTADTRIGVSNVGRGAALVFTTSHHVVALREHVAELIVPPAMRSVPSRLDNIRGGVRLVFETEAETDVDALRGTVREHARHMAKTCGLVFVKQADATAQEAQAEEPPPPTPHALDKRHAKQRKKGEPRQPESKAEKPKVAKRPSEASKTKPKPKSKPKEAEKRTDGQKPPTNDKPKEDKRPPLPRLPGVQPEPLPKRRLARADP